jgi:hypothetical protein
MRERRDLPPRREPNRLKPAYFHQRPVTVGVYDRWLDG